MDKTPLEDEELFVRAFRSGLNYIADQGREPPPIAAMQALADFIADEKPSVSHDQRGVFFAGFNGGAAYAANVLDALYESDSIDMEAIAEYETFKDD
jgi:predicted esterase